MTHDFTGKSIKCDTWEQMLHLAELADGKGYKKFFLSESDFEDGECYFITDNYDMTYFTSDNSGDEIVIHYSDFINILPNEVVEVTGCGTCIMHTKLAQHDYQYCAYPNKQQSCQMHVDMFANCPLKESSITIKLKQNDTTGN